MYLPAENPGVTKTSNPVYLLIALLLLTLLPRGAKADGIKFKIKNTSKNALTVFYRVSKRSGNFKVKSLGRFKADEEDIRRITVSKGDTIAFYGQDQQDQTSAIVKRDYQYLDQHKDQLFYIPVLIPEKQSASFESLQNLSLQLQNNKVLNFLLKMDSTAVSGFTLLENNFQNVYPLGTFIFVDTKTNRLLLPPLEPSFWNSNENYLTIQDSLYALVNTKHEVQAGAQVAYFLGKLCDNFSNANTVELDFKGKLSLLRWKPTPTANIYQVFDDKAVKSFIQRCYAQIDNPDQEYQRYRLYFLCSYERIDDLEVYGKQYHNFGNQTDLSISSNPGFQLISSNLGLLYAKDRTLSNYYSVQNAVMRTKAYDFTSLLFNGFKNNTKNNIINDTYAHEHQLESSILGEYQNLISYNPNPAALSLAKLSRADSSAILPVVTTVANLSPYNYQLTDTAKTTVALAKNDQVTAYNTKVKIYNAHLSSIDNLIKQLNQVDTDLDKITRAKSDNPYPFNSKSNPGLLNEIEVNNSIVRKD
ncbi:hypothetical protein [Mucilaginibacter dorajii]|uniref:Uncharacterized protein n=1 Tax=Mucilaginibacter dorajii TaxID=692994 RepID=A0ABP7PUD9_9SPHI|nr:hypothetical protein [Mucilaginibacter dorajii]MCS3735093.1 hypothetical protein [Mucilaginibacter dorajii]